jgi:hypothetical protein
MWDELKRTDVELARQKIAALRSITLRRHEDEIKQLDADEAEIDVLARLAEAITEKHLNGRTHSDEPIDTSSVADETMHPEAPPEPVPPPNLDIKQNVSPNFGSPLRRLVRR